ncbi:MAG: DUF4097 family beta strand repeat-containing protein [Peptococcaceae bacterium]|nr:DUF4097 family beta strand repeat-containing protein [Peptococcaceae bacterium]
MDARIKYFLKKTRRYQALFVAVAVLCLLVFLVFNFSLNDRHGAFSTPSSNGQQLEIPLDRESLQRLSIEASNVKLELGMASSLSKPQVTVSGQGYTNQMAKVDIKDGNCVIRLLGDEADEESLTMQVLLPQSDLESVTINGQAVNLHVDQLRVGYLGADIDGGYGYFANVKAKGIDVVTDGAPLRFADNRATSVSVDGDETSLTMLENKFEQVQTALDSGDIFVYNKRAHGQWQMDTVEGDITMLTQNLPYNLLIDAAVSGDGATDVSYEGRFWKDAQVVRETAQRYYGSVGNNPTKTISCTTDDGDIDIGKRARYSDMDPYASDYPYANTNPYLIERGTITK